MASNILHVKSSAIKSSVIIQYNILVFEYMEKSPFYSIKSNSVENWKIYFKTRFKGGGLVGVYAGQVADRNGHSLF
jgi:hypothetical protein